MCYCGLLIVVSEDFPSFLFGGGPKGTCMNTIKLCKEKRDFVFNTTVILELIRFLDFCLETTFP